MLLSGWYSRVFLWERFCLFVFVLFPYSSRYNNSLWECFQIILVSYAVCAVWKGKCLQTCLDVPDNVGLVLQWDSLGGTQIEFQWVRQELGKIWWTVLIWRAFRFLALRIKKTKHLSPAPPPPPPQSRCNTYQIPAKIPFSVWASWFPLFKKHVQEWMKMINVTPANLRQGTHTLLSLNKGESEALGD